MVVLVEVVEVEQLEVVQKTLLQVLQVEQDIKVLLFNQQGNHKLKFHMQVQVAAQVDVIVINITVSNITLVDLEVLQEVALISYRVFTKRKLSKHGNLAHQMIHH